MHRHSIVVALLVLAAAVAWSGRPAHAQEPASSGMVCAFELQIAPSVAGINVKGHDALVAWGNTQIAAGRTHMAMFGPLPCAW
jgi:hypothetical protein